MLQNLFKFTLLLFFVLGLSYLLHVYIFSNLYPEASLDLINFSYKFNGGITLLFTSTIILFSEKIKHQIGFIFLAGSFVKLAVFLYLSGQLGFSMEKSVFFNFFISYLVCLILEITYVVKILAAANFKENN